MTTAGSTASLAVGTDSSVATGSGLLLEKKGEVTEELVRLRKCSLPGLDSAVQRRMVSEASTPNLTHRPVRTNPSTFRAKLSSPGCCGCYQAVSSAPPRRKEGLCARANLRDELPDMATRRFRYPAVRTLRKEGLRYNVLAVAHEVVAWCVTTQTEVAIAPSTIQQTLSMDAR